MTAWLRLWWRQSDHYEQLSAHLHSRGMASITRCTIASIAAALALVSLGTIASATGPHGVVQRVCALAGAGGAALAALLWVLRWPPRAQAIRFAVLSNASIALAALAQSDPLAGMLACTSFATVAGYIALFHTAPLMAYNFAIAALTGAVEVVRLAARTDLMSALCGYVLVLTLNFAVPFGIQTVVHVLRTDAIRAERDQLTGLLNRRAFRRRARALLERERDGDAGFVVTVIDLDRFKQLNDSYGHSTGDDALVGVARALRDNTGETAVIGRSGGEEFVIADSWHPEEVGPRARRLCIAIAALPFGITASVGTAAVHLAGAESNADDLIRKLMSAADAAMYAAKRRGGNQADHYRLATPMADEATETDYRSDGVSA